MTKQKDTLSVFFTLKIKVINKTMLYLAISVFYEKRHV